MSRKLNLVNELLSTARMLQQNGRPREAVAVLRKLLNWDRLPMTTLEEIHLRLAQLQLHLGQYRFARQHLLICIAYSPGNPHYHYLMGSAIERDPKGNPRRAARYFRQSLRLKADQPHCVFALGQLAERRGKLEQARRYYERAVAAAPDEALYFGHLIDLLCSLGRLGQARKLIIEARFAHAKDPAFVKIFNDFRFHELYVEQQRRFQSGKDGSNEAARLLPFLRPVAQDAACDVLTIRQRRNLKLRVDRSWRAKPHLPRPAWLSDTRQIP
jgi:tetratricopeptide (TPR) repeat protein